MNIIDRVEAIREEEKRIRKDVAFKMLELEAERDIQFALKQVKLMDKVCDKIFKF